MHCACRRLALLVRAAEKVMHGRKGHCVLLVGDWAEAYGATNVASRLYAATANRTSRGPAAAIRPTSAQEPTLPESVVSASAVTGQKQTIVAPCQFACGAAIRTGYAFLIEIEIGGLVTWAEIDWAAFPSSRSPNSRSATRSPSAALSSNASASRFKSAPCPVFSRRAKARRIASAQGLVLL